ncbi:ribosomal protein L1p/L10e family-domain-containing protein [Chlamydoabsidia padenii]|nr:ribosomal protein L1p/L10e family-domain-containing protein [Chlamydoabsidia padenii]
MTSGKGTRHRSVALPHCILPEDGEVCLITRDQPKLYQEKIDGLDFDRKITVYSGKGFREKYKTMEARRQVARKYALFLIDAPLAPKINSMFGTSFNNANKNPLIVKVSENEHIMVDGEKIKENINNAINSINVTNTPSDLKKSKFGKADMSEEELFENLKVVLEDMKEHLEWKYVVNVSIQADQSVSLPIYSCVPGVWLLEEEEEKPTKEQVQSLENKPVTSTKVKTEKKIAKPTTTRKTRAKIQ